METSRKHRPYRGIVFVDMKERNERERDRLRQRKAEIEARGKANGGTLPPVLQKELRSIELLLAQAVVDPLFAGVLNVTRLSENPESPDSTKLIPGVRDVLADVLCSGSKVDDHHDGFLCSQQVETYADVKALKSDEASLAAVYGILETDNVFDPKHPGFSGAVTSALGEYTNHKDLFSGVLQILVAEGTKKARAPKASVTGPSEVVASQWVDVVRALVTDRVPADDKHLKLKTLVALGRDARTDDAAPRSAIDIDLPDLEQTTDVEIQVDNILATQALYFAAMLDELRLFTVVDKLVEQFQNGLLPLGKGTAGDALYSYWKKGANRISEVERRNLYARVFGFPGGDPSQQNLNREFNDLFIRFVSGVSSFVRQMKVDEMFRSSIAMPVSVENVRKAARDLAGNLSLYGYGIAYFAATDLQAQIQEIIKLLSNPEIRSAYGARDMWGVVDQVASLELGGARNSFRYRTMAQSGAVVIRWLADNAGRLTGARTSSILDITEIRNAASYADRHKPTVDPTDRDLVDACEQWLAVTGTPDRQVEEYAQPSEGPSQTSSPVRIPAAARDLLESAGVSLPR